LIASALSRPSFFSAAPLISRYFFSAYFWNASAVFNPLAFQIQTLQFYNPLTQVLGLLKAIAASIGLLLFWLVPQSNPSISKFYLLDKLLHAFKVCCS